MNHLLIGLGDTGGRILAVLRQRLLLQHGSIRPPRLGIDFLHLDEGTRLAREDAPHWHLLGESLQLPRRNRLALDLRPATLSALLNTHPALRRGLNQLERQADLPSVLGALAGGIGRRRLAHWALTAELTRCHDTLQTLSRELLASDPARRLTWHLCCHLGSGLGSGLLPGLLLQLQRLRLSLPAEARIVLHAALPEATATDDTTDEPVRARAYASLMELVAMANSSASTEAAATGRNQSLFDACYLSQHPEAHAQLAEFLHRQIVQPDIGATLPQRRDAPTFVGLGLHQLGSAPDRDLAHLGHEQALRVLHHLRHDHWRNGLGYVDQPRPSAQAGLGIDTALRQRWGVTDADLQLTTTADAADTTPLWHEYERHFRTLVADLPVAEQLPHLQALFEQAWQGGLQGTGVERRYAQADDDLFHLADARASRIETELLQDWRSGTRSLHDGGRLVAAMMADIAARGEQAEQRAGDQQERAQHLQQQFDALLTRSRSTEPAGWTALTRRLSGADTARRSLELDNATTLLREHAIARTEAAAQGFAGRHARRLASRLGDLLGLIDAVELAIGGLADEFQTRALACLPEREADNPDDARRRIDEMRLRLLGHETSQRSLADELRQTLFNLLGERANFRTFALELAEDHLCHVVLARSTAATGRWLAEQPVASLWDMLGPRWHDAPDRQGLDLAELARGALRGQPGGGSVPEHWILVTPDDLAPAELQPALGSGLAAAILQAATPQPGTAMVAAPAVPGCAVLDPQARPDTPPALSLRLLAAAHEVGDRPVAQQLSLISLAPHQTLTDAAWLRPLHTAYERVRLRAGAAAAALHVEGDAAALPLLLTPDRSELPAQARRLLLLAAALGLLQPGTDPASGATRLLLVRLDGDGFELERCTLGADLASAADALDPAMLAELRRAIGAQDLARRVHAADRHDALRDTLRQHIETIRSSVAATELDATSLAWNEAARAVMRFIRQEAPL